MADKTHTKPTPQQQLASMNQNPPQTAAQAEKRLKLGYQLFEAAEARIKAQREVAADIKQGQQQVREELLQDVAQHIEERVTRTLDTLDRRIARLEAKVEGDREHIQEMVHRSETLLDQARSMLGKDTAPAEQKTSDSESATSAEATPPQHQPEPDCSSSQGDSVVSDQGGLYQTILRKLRRDAGDEDGSTAA